MSQPVLPRAATDAPIHESPRHERARTIRSGLFASGGDLGLRPAASATVSARIGLASVRLGGMSGRAISLALGAGSGLLGLALFIRGQLGGIGLVLEGRFLGSVLARNREAPADVASVL